jgi:hypothetical protein
LKIIDYRLPDRGWTEVAITMAPAAALASVLREQRFIHQDVA